jgi:hypothetical protein
MGRCGLLVFVVALGCASFTPYSRSTEALAESRMTTAAVVVLEGDLAAVLATGAVFVGELHAHGEERASEWAADAGGTHVYRSRGQVGPHHVRKGRWAVLRAPWASWAALPPALRPLPAFARTHKGCIPLRPLPNGCKYTHYRSFSSFHGNRVFVRCDGKDAVDVTHKLQPGTCAFAREI